MKTNKVNVKGYIGEFQVNDYLEYAYKKGDILPVNIGNKALYKIYLSNLKKSKSEALVTNHKYSLDALLASYGQETLVCLNGKQVRRLNLDIEKVPYKELQDQLVGDFVFYYPKINQIIIVDNMDYNEKRPNLLSTRKIQKKIYKLKQRTFLYKAIAKTVLNLSCHYIGVLWNSNTDLDLLEEIDEWHKENAQLRTLYAKNKKKGENINHILTQIHVKTNINLDKLEFDITGGIYK